MSELNAASRLYNVMKKAQRKPASTYAILKVVKTSA